MICTACGHTNAEGSRYCAQCGQPLDGIAVSDVPKETSSAPSTIVDTGDPPADPYEPEPSIWSTAPTEAATDTEWRMSSPGPLPEPKRRRRVWLWILLGIVGACILGCVAFLIWSNTAGEGFLNDLATRVADGATPRAGK